MPQTLGINDPLAFFPMLSAALLAGGASRRMGQDKAMLPFSGGTLGGNSANQLQKMFHDVWVVERQTERLGFWPAGVQMACDLAQYPACALTGIATALAHARHPWVFVIACDMPHPNPALIAGLCNIALSLPDDGPSAVIPHTESTLHPLHGVYHQRLLPELRQQLDGNNLRLQPFVRRHAKLVAEATLRLWNPDLRGLDNLNTPAELAHSRSTTAAKDYDDLL